MSEQDASENQAASEQATESPAGKNPVKVSMDPVRKWTFITLAISILLLTWYLVSDRLSPRTSQARVHALVVPIAPEVSGTVISIEVGNNQRVKAGQEYSISILSVIAWQLKLPRPICKQPGNPWALQAQM